MDERRYEGEPVVKYRGTHVRIFHCEGISPLAILFKDKSSINDTHCGICPLGVPKAMIEAIAVSRDAQNKMDELWDMGVEAAHYIKLEVEVTPLYSRVVQISNIV